ncbi:metallophosphoesterase [Xanthocytophaga agilis]|uniref:Metallophosphoesterase n=1 Tax=Xanthocytophaga agilis TaxID=3048010 RepID=A0AAE3UHX7_9BACT|nr:metallophosphoesterase [Xanthocytophaga agilis]MDJ1504766.1 metallophosphoesterase [Xanthocytophaga agilis]
MKRRKFMYLTGAGILGGLYTWQVEPFWLEFVKLKMPVRNLPNNLVGKTVMQISDIHIGKRFDHRFVIDSFQKAQAFNPDFVVYTGDYVSTHKDQVLYQELSEVLTHCVKGKHGTVGILGNHDYGKNWSQQNVADNISEMLEQNGVYVLRNAQTETAGLTFIGIDDYWGLNFLPKRAMKEYDSNKPTIVLCHNPDVCDLDVWNNYAGWILSGHTHGGQCKPPFLPPPVLPVKNKKYTAGKIELGNDRVVYINRALGNLWQIRFNVRPEITLFELERA